jgi:predicted DNA-binding protein (MmcQ/YjbR family)
MNRKALEKFCMALPGTTKDIKWGADLVFSVGDKMYCVTAAEGNDHGLSFKVSEPLFDVMTKKKGITPAAYAARYHWISVEKDALRQKELESLIKDSYRLVASKLSKKKQKELGLL